MSYLVLINFWIIEFIKRSFSNFLGICYIFTKVQLKNLFSYCFFFIWKRIYAFIKHNYICGVLKGFWSGPNKIAQIKKLQDFIIVLLMLIRFQVQRDTLSHLLMPRKKNFFREKVFCFDQLADFEGFWIQITYFIRKTVENIFTKYHS